MGIILKNAQNAARDGVLSSRDVGSLISKALENGELSRAEIKDLEKVQSELESSMTPDARVALQRFLSMGDNFDGNLAGEIFGLNQDQGDKLEKAGISTVTNLLIASKMPEDRQKLANEAQIDLVKLTNFVEQADLSRVVGVGKQYAALLHGVGINNPQELSRQDPDTLKQKLSDFMATPEGREIASRRPSSRAVNKWVQNAKTLPKMMHYVNDDSASFTKEAFDSLKDYQKAMLFWGSDVRVGNGGVFEHEDLSVSVPRRKPTAVNNYIREVETSGFNGDFEFAELADIERIKLGDDTLGYRMTFDVKSESVDSEAGVGGAGHVDSELGGGGIIQEGTVSVALDPQGNVLDIEYDMWHTDHE